MPILTCERCSYSRPSMVDAPGQVVGQTDYRKHLIAGLVCGYKEGRACVVDELNARERERERSRKGKQK